MFPQEDTAAGGIGANGEAKPMEEDEEEVDPLDAFMSQNDEHATQLIKQAEEKAKEEEEDIDPLDAFMAAEVLPAVTQNGLSKPSQPKVGSSDSFCMVCIFQSLRAWFQSLRAWLYGHSFLATCVYVTSGGEVTHPTAWLRQLFWEARFLSSLYSLQSSVAGVCRALAGNVRLFGEAGHWTLQRKPIFLCALMWHAFVGMGALK